MKGHDPLRVKTRSTSRNNGSPLWLAPKLMVGLLLPALVGIFLGTLSSLVNAQSDGSVRNQEDQLIRKFEPPAAPAPAPVYQAPPSAPAPAPAPEAPAPAQPSESTAGAEPTAPARPTEAAKPAQPASTGPLSQYVLEFNRSPVVGNGMRMRGIYTESRLSFTRPRDWNLRSAKALIRFRHSPALLANRSNLTVRVNGTSVGSVPLNRRESQIGEFLVNIPPNLIQNYNEITIAGQHNNNPTCSDPADPTLWSEILPDSKLTFDFIPKPVPLDFSSYPYPLFDELSLDASQVTYLTPNQVNESWLTAAARLQASLGRLADFRPVNTRLAKNLNQVQTGQRLVIIGTPEQQPALKSLKLPYQISGNQFVDGSKSPLPEDVGLLMLATTRNGSVPVLVVTGNGSEGVQKAAQFLVQPQARKLGTGASVLVDQVSDIPSPPPRQWGRQIPEQSSFTLKDLKGADGKPFEKDITVRGSFTPPVDIDFRTLPDERFNRGSSMTLFFSHSPQVNPRLSTVEVRLDGQPIGGKRLTAEDGANRDSLNVNLPENLLTPTSKLQVAFNLAPKEPNECGRITDQQLWGTVHTDTKFDLKREMSVQQPDLKLLQVGYPFAGPQDLSSTAIVVPDAPSDVELQTLLQFSERMGRLSRADSVKLTAYPASGVPEDVRRQKNLVGIGKRDKFPLPEALQSQGFQLGDLFARSSDQSRIQTLPDSAGVIKQVISPYNGDRSLLALMAQSDSGLEKVRDTFRNDALFFKLKDDTVLVNTTSNSPSIYDDSDYSMEFFQQSRPKRQESVNPLGKATRFLQENWYLLPTGIVLSALLLYGIVQLYLKRVALGDSKE